MADAIQDLRHETTEVANLTARLRDLCGDDDQAFLDTLEGETEVVEAARRVVRWIYEQNAFQAANSNLSHTYKDRAEIFEDRAERGREALLRFLEEVGMKSMPLPEATITLVNGGQKLVGEAKAEVLPDEFVRTRKEVDRAAILAALKEGKTVDGFSLSNAGPSIQIRVRR